MLETPQHALSLWPKLKPHLMLVIGLLILTFSLRIIHLTLWPIFADEAIYIRWSQVMRAEPTLRFLPLSDGKQPLFMWITIPFLKIISDPLIAGRLVSVLTGTATALGLYIFTFIITHRRFSAFVATLLYALVPYTVFFDRYALADSMLLMFGIWSLVFLSLTAIFTRLDTALLSGGFLGLSLLTKSPALVFLGLSVLVPFLFKRFTLWHYFKFASLLLISFFLAFACYNLLRLGPEFHQINLRNQDYRFPTAELLADPLLAARGNTSPVLGFFFLLLTPGILVCSFIGLIHLIRVHKPQSFFFLIWILIPSLIEIFVARSVTARYFLFIIPPFLLLASIGLTRIWFIYRNRSSFRIAALFLVFAYPLYQTFLIITNPQKVNLPRIERSGYLEEWTAGTGMQDIAKFIDNQSQSGSVVVGTEGFFGTTPDGLQIYFDKHPNVTIFGNSFLLDRVPQALKTAALDNQAYLVINDERLKVADPQSQGLTLISAFPKAIRPDGTHQSLMLYQVSSD